MKAEKRPKIEARLREIERSIRKTRRYVARHGEVVWSNPARSGGSLLSRVVVSRGGAYVGGPV